MASEKKFAVLVDADNISNKYIKFILDEISNFGIATYKRIYGDWTKPELIAWKKILLDNSFLPVQQYGYTTGKNSTDSTMIIDAMDILYSGNVDGFCLASSDSDFTRLAARLRESGMYVLGMGEKKTPSAFISACDKFTYLDVLAAAPVPSIPESNLDPEDDADEPDEMDQPYEYIIESEDNPDIVNSSSRSSAASKSKKKKRPTKAVVKEKEADNKMTNLNTVKKAMVTIVNESSDEDGWVFIGDIGNVLIKRYPDFDVRNFGFSKLTPFIKSLGLFEINPVKVRDTNNKLIYVRVK